MRVYTLRESLRGSMSWSGPRSSDSLTGLTAIRHVRVSSSIGVMTWSTCCCQSS